MKQMVVGVDTHKSTHVAVAIDGQGARLGTLSIPASADGYAELATWARALGSVRAFGIEGTGSFGAGLSRSLRARGHAVIDVARPTASGAIFMANPTVSMPRALRDPS